jgi:serine phosphatase RsbU (regulator of sigma subunit)
MLRRVTLSVMIIILSSCINFAGGQDTLRVRSELILKRQADSLQTVDYLRTAERLRMEGREDSAIFYIGKSIEKASSDNFVLLESSGYEMLAIIYDARSDWEESLRNYLKALSASTKAGEKAGEARLSGIIAEKYFNAGVYKKSASYSEQQFLLYDEKDQGSLANSAEMAAKSYYYLPQDSLSSKWYSAALFYYQKKGDQKAMLRCSEKLGALYTRLGRFDDALAEYDKILSSYSSANDNKNEASAYNLKGFLMFKTGDVNAALSYFTSAVESSGKGGKDNYFLTEAWSNIAICHQNLGNQKEMLQSFEKALSYAKESGRTDEEARIERILSLIYYNKGDNYHAELYCLDCIESAKKSRNLEVLQLCYKDYSTVLENGNDFIQALDYYEKHLNLRDSLNYESRIAEKAASDRLAEFEATEQRLRSELSSDEIRSLEVKTLRAEASRKENEYMLLLKQQELDRSEKDKMAQSLILEKERFELSNREQDIRSLKQQQAIDSLSLKQKDDSARVLTAQNNYLEAEKKRQEDKAEQEKRIRKMVVGIGILIALVAMMILAGLISTRRQNQKLAENKRHIEKINTDLEITNAEVLKQKDIIEQKNQSITDSIQYASRIQEAVLPPADFLTEWGIDNFILYKPKDIVSGDFYWGIRKGNRIVIAAGDCTGHGVPGAFMSMLGHALLDEIISTKELEDAAGILNHLRDGVISTLKQKGTTGETRDGMDISLVILDLQDLKLDYAGANNPLYIIRENKMKKIQADRMPIGIHFISFTPFTNHNMELKKGDYLYLFSDGFADQFGGPDGRKFMYKPFQDLLLRNHSKTMELQKEILDNTFEKWKGESEQVDDVLVIGMHLT